MGVIRVTSFWIYCFELCVNQIEWRSAGESTGQRSTGCQRVGTDVRLGFDR